MQACNFYPPTLTQLQPLIDVSALLMSSVYLKRMKVICYEFFFCGVSNVMRCTRELTISRMTGCAWKSILPPITSHKAVD